MSAKEKVLSRHAKELAQAEIEDAITASIPAAVAPLVRHVHPHELYGTVGVVKFGDSSSFGGKAIAWETLRNIVRALPPEPRTMVKDGCTSLPPRAYVEALPEEKKARWSEESDVSPILVTIEGFQGPHVLIEWYARLPGVGLVRVEACMGYGPPKEIGHYSAKRVDLKGGHRYEPAKFTPAPELHTVFSRIRRGGYSPDDARPIAQLESPIRWASGGPEYPNRMTLYFVDLGADLNAGDVGVAIVDYLADLAAGSDVRKVAP